MAKDRRPGGLVADIREFRSRMIRVLLVLVIATGASFAFADQLLQWIAEPVGELVYLAPAEALMTSISLALTAGVIIVLPYILVNAASFAGRRLPRRSRRRLWFILILGYLLFMAGIAFAYHLVVPLALNFLLSFATDKIRPMLAMGSYVAFVVGLVIPFGLVFQLPLTIAALARIGLVSPAGLRRQRRMALLVIIVVSAFITPPDVVSQLLMAGPVLLLYELGVILARVAWRERAIPDPGG